MGDSLVESARHLSGKLEGPGKPKLPTELSKSKGKGGKGRGIKRTREEKRNAPAPKKARKLESAKQCKKATSLPSL